MFLGIDIGTSGVKAVVVSVGGAVLGQASAALSVSRPHDLWSEQNPDDWWTATCAAVVALDPALRDRLLPGTRFGGAANVLVFANTDAASGVRNILKMKANGLEVGPILMGMGNKAHIVTPSITARGLLNISALAGTPVTHYG